MMPVWGLTYYLSPPQGMAAALNDPLRFVVYVIIMMTACAMFSRFWITVSHMTSRDVAQQLHDQAMVIPGHRDKSTVKFLDRYIPIAAMFGGASLALLSVCADLLGAIGSGTGILLMVGIISNYYEIMSKEQAEGMSLSELLSFQ